MGNISTHPGSVKFGLRRDLDFVFGQDLILALALPWLEATLKRIGRNWCKNPLPF
jgi:hypothetical protein